MHNIGMYGHHLVVVRVQKGIKGMGKLSKEESTKAFKTIEAILEEHDSFYELSPREGVKLCGNKYCPTNPTKVYLSRGYMSGSTAEALYELCLTPIIHKVEIIGPIDACYDDVVDKKVMVHRTKIDKTATK